MSDESESDDSNDSKENTVSYMAFAASVNDVGCPSEVGPFVLMETCDEDLHVNSDEDFNLQRAYNQLFNECPKQKKMNKALLKKLANAKLGKESLCEPLHNLNCVIP